MSVVNLESISGRRFLQSAHTHAPYRHSLLSKRDKKILYPKRKVQGRHDRRCPARETNEPGKKKGQLPAGLNGGVCCSRADSAAEAGDDNSIEIGLVLRATRPIDFSLEPQALAKPTYTTKLNLSIIHARELFALQRLPLS